MLTATEIQEKVNAYIASLPYERRPKSLYDPIEYVLAAGGKRIRPSFVLMAYNLFHDDVDRILQQSLLQLNLLQLNLLQLNLLQILIK